MAWIGDSEEAMNDASLNIRLPQEQKDALIAEAKRLDVPLAQFIRSRLRPPHKPFIIQSLELDEDWEPPFYSTQERRLFGNPDQEIGRD